MEKLLNRFKPWALWSTIVIMGFIIIFHFIITPRLFRMQADFTYQADILSFDNFYDVHTGSFSGEILSNTHFSYKVDSVINNNNYLINNVFDVRKPSGEPIFAVKRMYGVDPLDKKHIPDLGDKNRSGYLFAPSNLKKDQDFTYWHINYDNPATMKYDGTEIMSGMKIYRYKCKYQADQTSNLEYLPGVPQERGVELDILLTLWIEPHTGHLIKYEDHTTAWYYNIETKERIHPWNKFHNEYTDISINEHLYIAKGARQISNLIRITTPLALILVIIFVLLIGLKVKDESWWQILLVPFLILIAGISISYYVFTSHLQQTKSKEKLRFYSECQFIQNQIQQEMNVVIQEIRSLKKFHELNSEEGNTMIRELWDYFGQQQKGIQSIFLLKKEFLVDSDKTYSFQPLLGFDTATKEKNTELHFSGLQALKKASKSGQATLFENDNFMGHHPLSESFSIVIPIDNPNSGNAQHTAFLLGNFDTHRILEKVSNQVGINKNILIIFSGDESASNKAHIDGETLSISNKIRLADRVIDIEYQLEYAPKISNITERYAILIIGIMISIFISVFVFRILKDKTKELRELNQVLVQNHKDLMTKNSELEQFTYIASHDLQQPLVTIYNFSSLLQEDYQDKLDDTAMNYVNLINNSTTRMIDLVKTLLVFSRTGRNKELKQVNTNDLVNDVLSDMRSLIESSKSEIIAADLPIMNAYPTELRLLFQNLISNAIKFQKENNTPRIEINYFKTKVFWHFSVRDNGIGIKEADRERVFNFFQQLHKKSEYHGTGIGLGHCKKIVDMHKGSIWVESKEDEGSTFWFTIKRELR